jgi:hypothetical protein
MIGEDDGDRLSDVAHHAIGDHGLLVRCGVMLVGPRHAERNFGEGWADVLRGEDRVNSRHSQGGRSIKRPNLRVCDGASENDGVPLSLPPNVVDVFAAPAQKAAIFDALDRSADVRITPAHPGDQRIGTSW